jgi:hypothetical protein
MDDYVYDLIPQDEDTPSVLEEKLLKRFTSNLSGDLIKISGQLGKIYKKFTANIKILKNSNPNISIPKELVANVTDFTKNYLFSNLGNGNTKFGYQWLNSISESTDPKLLSILEDNGITIYKDITQIPVTPKSKIYFYETADVNTLSMKLNENEHWKALNIFEKLLVSHPLISYDEYTQNAPQLLDFYMQNPAMRGGFYKYNNKNKKNKQSKNNLKQQYNLVRNNVSKKYKLQK